MKKYLLAAVCVLAAPLLAQAPAYEVEYPLPADIYEALWSLPALQQVEENAKQTGGELTEQQKKDLAKYTERVKGIVGVEITGERCPPCLAFARMLKEDTFLEELKSKGGRFYQLDLGTEKGLAGKKLSSDIWGITGMPYVLFFKDGAPIYLLKGFDKAQWPNVKQALRQKKIL